MARACPPGVFCLSEGIILVCGAGLLLFCIVLYLMKPTTVMVHTPPSIPIVNHGGSAYERAPQPLRDWMAMPELPPRGGLTAMPVNIPTQGLPESFQSIGIVTVGEKVLPLYGRRTAGSSDRWNYYTRTDSYNPVPIPVQFGKRDCMDDVGCQEIMSGESVQIDALHQVGKTTIYRFDGPKYIPGMI